MRARVVYLQSIFDSLTDEQKGYWLVGDTTLEKFTDTSVGATKFRKDGGIERCLEVNGVSVKDFEKLQLIKSEGYIIELFVNPLGDDELPINANGQTVNEWRAGRGDLYVEEGV